MALRSSQRAIDAIVNYEVTSPAVYTRLYARPMWPKGKSGVTIGIGYDLGFQTKQSVASDWRGLIDSSMIANLGTVCGIRGAAAGPAAARIRNAVMIPFDAAMQLFKNKDMPRWESTVLKNLPGSENLPPDCFGALVSLTLNRGASFQTAGDRYSEMRGIRAALIAGHPEQVPDLIRHMKRIWAGEADSSGLVTRRDAEADMFELGLHRAGAAVTPLVTDFSSSNVEVLDMRPVFSLAVQNEQKTLIEVGYPEVGDADGKFGGKTRAAITAFLTDRMKSQHNGDRTVAFQDELSKASVEVRSGTWHRPIADKRANATVEDISAKVPGVNQNAFQKGMAWVLGLPSLIFAGAKSLFGDSHDPNSYIDTVKNVFSGVPTSYYLVVVVGICIAIYLAARHSDQSIVKAYNENKIN